MTKKPSLVSLAENRPRNQAPETQPTAVEPATAQIVAAEEKQRRRPPVGVKVTSVEMPVSTWRALQMQKIAEDRPMKDIIVDAVEAYIKARGGAR
jgi:hypothetical protein